MSDLNDDFHRKLLGELASASFKEQRARRRWGVFFKLLFFSYLIAITILYYQNMQQRSIFYTGDTAHAAIIKISGIINANNDNSAATINNLLREAFRNDNSKGIILEINSPGGSAVESHRIYNEIQRLRKKYPDKPLIAVAGDFCTSGGYFIAAAADSIYADPASVLGSIGVILSSFGFVDAMEKLGIERRVQTAGGSKSLLDPFLPQKEQDRATMKKILNDIHAVFKEAVKSGRGDRLSADERLFTGTLFSGSEGVEVGLIDGFNDIGGVARDIIGVDEVLYYNRQYDWLDTIIGKFGILFADNHILALPTASYLTHE